MDKANVSHARPLIVGLTGGIAAGKTTVANYFAELGAHVLNADQIARELTAPKSELWKAVIKLFGTKILLATEQIDRDKLRDIVFNDTVKRRELESLLHPAIRKALKELSKAGTSSYQIWEIPLLLETKMNQEVDRVLVVDAKQNLQIQRLNERDGTPKESAETILATQVSREERLRQADDVIANDGERTALREQVQALHQYYLALAQQKVRL